MEIQIEMPANNFQLWRSFDLCASGFPFHAPSNQIVTGKHWISSNILIVTYIYFMSFFRLRCPCFSLFWVNYENPLNFKNPQVVRFWSKVILIILLSHLLLKPLMIFFINTLLLSIKRKIGLLWLWKGQDFILFTLASSS